MSATPTTPDPGANAGRPARAPSPNGHHAAHEPTAHPCACLAELTEAADAGDLAALDAGLGRLRGCSGCADGRPAREKSVRGTDDSQVKRSSLDTRSRVRGA
ncbi:MAG: hypothetical protein L0I76_31180 [Pseudonocardia sp.]|nr:hypothetical protein [Pseudonocardia sp.]